MAAKSSMEMDFTSARWGTNEETGLTVLQRMGWLPSDSG